MPSRLGRYAVRRRIGSGGFATVWLAYDEQLDSPVAVKVLADNWTEDHHVRQRFLEEGRYLRKVESPARRVGLRRRRARRRPALPGDVVRRPGHAGGPARGRGAHPGAGAGGGPPGRRRAPGAAPARHPAPRREAGQRALPHRRPTTAPAGPRGPGDGRRPRARQGARHVLAADHDRRHPVVRRPRAGPGRGRSTRAPTSTPSPSLAYLLLAGRAPYSHASLAAAASPGPPPPLSTPERPFPADVEAVVRRGLAPDREDRWPDVASFVDGARRAALDDRVAAHRRPRSRGCRVDPQLTQPGAAPSPRPASRRPGRARRRPARGRRRAVGVLVGLRRAGRRRPPAGYLVEQRTGPDATLSDAPGNLVGDGARRLGPGGRRGRLDAADHRTRTGAVTRRSRSAPPADWTATDATGAGRLPRHPARHRAARPRCPGTPSAARPRSRSTTPSTGNASVTVVYTGCPGGVTVERVVQVAGNRLLWVQVRSADRATANAVLDAVQTHGI